MKASTHYMIGITAMALFVGSVSAQTERQPAGAQDQASPPASQSTVAGLETQAQQTINIFKQKDPTLDALFQSAAGYAVFPTVGEGAVVIGAAHGKGLLYQNGQPVGQATVTKASVGAQVGGQSYSELIFFQSPQALQDFKNGNFEISAGLSAVAARDGAGRAVQYSQGVAVFTTSRTGLMAQADIGGQKFAYQPLPGQSSGSQGAVGSFGGAGGSTSGNGSTSGGTSQ